MNTHFGKTHLFTVIALLLTIVGSFAFVPSSAQTTPRTYDVELVIFRNVGPGGSPEQWATAGAAPAAEAAAEAPSSSAGEAAYPKLTPARLKLGGVADALKRNKNYQPLAHVGWTQPANDRENARFVTLSSLGIGQGLDGRVALSRGRYLHLTLDLSLQIPGEDARYTIKQTRRMRSGERHYIDHPRFGIIALITPSGAAAGQD